MWLSLGWWYFLPSEHGADRREAVRKKQKKQPGGDEGQRKTEGVPWHKQVAVKGWTLFRCSLLISSAIEPVPALALSGNTQPGGNGNVCLHLGIKIKMAQQAKCNFRFPGSGCFVELLLTFQLTDFLRHWFLHQQNTSFKTIPSLGGQHFCIQKNSLY